MTSISSTPPRTAFAPPPGQAQVYRRLRALAARFLRRERADHTLQPTALAHEVYLRFADDQRFRDLESADVLGVAARVMRQVLVDHARRKKALKREGRYERTPLDATCVVYEQRAVDLIALDDALSMLAKVDAEAARIVEMRFFGGLTEPEIAVHLDVCTRTVRRGWRAARLWLARELAAE
ncbi:MAG: ECF-type sigma factor [Planctomycetota bacterium]|jgi:RNA polymerase sigma factor (TIGR02999 family)